MFERKNFKKAAREQLKGRWKIPVLTTLLVFVLIGILYGATGLDSTPNATTKWKKGAHGFSYQFYQPSNSDSIISLLISCVAIVFYVAQLSVCNTMLKDDGEIHFSNFTDGLNQWWQAIRGGLWFLLWFFVWTILFVFALCIPGFVKAYSYSMMFFIMAENPKISVCKAMRLSKELTRGYKGDLFVLDLSFIFWAVIATIPCGLGWLLLCPYINMTKTNAYQYLKQTALNTNRVKPEDFE